MSDVRVPFEKEYDSPKRRAGGGGFGDLMSARSCGARSPSDPYSLMSDFIDEAYGNDGKLDCNEVEGMKVLAGLTPSRGKPDAPQSAPAPVPGQPIHTKPLPIDPPTAAVPKPKPQPHPQSDCPPQRISSNDFMQQVGQRMVESRGNAGAEGKTIDQATRVMDGIDAHKRAVLEEIRKMVCNDGAVSNEEACKLESFIDRLTHKAESPTPSGGRQLQNAHRWSPPQTGERVIDPRTRSDYWYSVQMNELVDSGVISYETGERIKRQFAQLNRPT